MPQTIFSTLLDSYDAKGEVLLVPGGDAEVVDFRIWTAIGLRDIDGDTVVVIASPLAAVVARIPAGTEWSASAAPSRPGGRDPCHMILAEMRKQHHAYRWMFPPESTVALLIMPVGLRDRAACWAPDEMAAVLFALNDLGLVPRHVRYVLPRRHWRPGQGTVLVVRRSSTWDKPPRVYVDEERAF